MTLIVVGEYARVFTETGVVLSLECERVMVLGC